ncbi:hypothetical protein [Natronospirillum operosum]|uniref:hypothetical protein n=1 Tax=Natronospirillum operosum TaxID=2759953 RepID=UPI001436BB1B|nr:hypothetical protein [Natronospirillum operosum]
MPEKACVSVPVAGSGLDTEGVANHPEIASALNSALEELVLVINETSGGQPDLTRN